MLPDPNLLTQISPWELRFLQIEPGRISVDVAMLPGSQLSILSFKSNLGLHQVGAAPESCITLGIPITGEVTRWRERDAAAGSLLSFGTGAEFEGTTRTNFHGLTFSLNEDYYDKLCETLGLPNADKARQFGLVAENRHSPRRAMISKSVLELLAHDRPILSSELEEEIASALILSMTDGDPQHDDKSTPATRAKARRRAIGTMLEFASNAMPISEICAVSGVSWRTLDRAFLEYFGFGPKTYYNMVRLCRVEGRLDYSRSELDHRQSCKQMGFSAYEPVYERLSALLP